MSENTIKISPESLERAKHDTAYQQALQAIEKAKKNNLANLVSCQA